MNYRRLGSSDLEISEISLGADLRRRREMNRQAIG